jgi:hypothetical protein
MIVFDEGKLDPLVAKSVVQQELIRHGVLWSGFHNVSFSHGDDDVACVLDAYRAALEVLGSAATNEDALSRLRGEPVEPTMRRTR